MLLIGMLLSYSISYTGNNLPVSTEFSAENNGSSENLIDTSDASADDQIKTFDEISYFDLNLNENKPLTSFFVLSQPSFSFWQPPKIS